MANSMFTLIKMNERKIRRDLIVDAAMSLFGSTPLSQISMRNIAAEGGFSVGSIYRYFPSQDDLFVEIFTRDIIDFDVRADDYISAGHSNLEEMVLFIADFFLENETIFQVLSYFMTKSDIDTDVLKKFYAAEKTIVRILDRVRRVNNPNEGISALSHALFSSILGSVMSFRNNPFVSRENRKASLHEALKLSIAALGEPGIIDSDKKRYNGYSKPAGFPGDSFKGVAVC